ncbi:MAG TPA: ATP-dependent serine peptidase containing a PDZ domain protein, partial [Terrimesophilobacter sp.]|nr:ATP-dependent serine peptidase containing a PDZ domain protein [Terrimesophilobacter sp.]
LSITYDFPVEVNIQLENVGGPSGGQIFALGIIDKLTPGSLTGGEDVAGTGTIDGTGDVGAIGGIVHKMFGARDAGARWFLAPVENCAEVVGHVPEGLTVIAVDTLDDSLAALGSIRAGADAASLPTCSAG